MLVFYRFIRLRQRFVIIVNTRVFLFLLGYFHLGAIQEAGIGMALRAGQSHCIDVAKMLNTIQSVNPFAKSKDCCSLNKKTVIKFYVGIFRNYCHKTSAAQLRSARDALPSDLSPARGLAYDILILSSMFADYQRYLLIMNVYKPNALQNLF